LALLHAKGLTAKVARNYHWLRPISTIAVLWNAFVSVCSTAFSFAAGGKVVGSA
jgi:hypothetical protein